MNVNRTHTRHALLLGMLLCPLLAGAAPSMEPPPGRSAGCDAHANGPPPRPPGPPMDAAFGAFGDDADRPPPFLMDLKLTEDQQDKVFAILHAAAPALRDQSKAVRKARDALRELARNTRYDDGSAASLAQTQGKAEGQLALLRTRMEHDLFSLLTPEQATQVTSHQPTSEPRRGEGPPPR